MRNLNIYLRDFLYGALGYTAGGLAGFLFIFLVSQLGLVRWLFGLIDENQVLVQILAIPVFAGFLLSLGGVILGGVGGWVLSNIMVTTHRVRLAAGSGAAFAFSISVLTLLFLLLSSLLALYNNLTTNRIDQFGLVFGVFGLIFGLITGILQSLMTVKLRHTWRVILASTLGFGLGGVILGVLLRLVNPTSGFQTVPVLTWIVLAIALLIPFAMGGGAMGFTYGWLAQRAVDDDQEVEEVQSGPWQLGILAIIGLFLAFTFFGFIDQAAEFLKINEAEVKTQIPSVTTGVHWSLPQTIPTDGMNPSHGSIDLTAGGTGPSAVVWEQEANIYLQSAVIDEMGMLSGWTSPVNISNSMETASSQPRMVRDRNGNHHIVWREGDPNEATEIFYSTCTEGSCSAPQRISDTRSLTCLSQEVNIQGKPEIAVDEDDLLMVAWNIDQDGLVYTQWSSSDLPPSTPAGCVPGAADVSEGNLALVSTEAGEFTLAYSTTQNDERGEIFMTAYSPQAWDDDPTPIGKGREVSFVADMDRSTHLAWCDPNGVVNYQGNTGRIETIDFPGCSGAPQISLGGGSDPHLVWYAEEITDSTGVVRPASHLVESIRTESGWSEAALAVRTSEEIIPSVASDEVGNIHMVWGDTPGNKAGLFYSEQENYECSLDDLSELERVVLETISNGGTRPLGTEIPYCRNQFRRIIYTPNPNPAYSNEPATPNGGFDSISTIADNARFEVLFATMQWEKNTADPSPGSVFAQEVGELYKQIKENPERYPRGLTVRILLGNYPEISDLQWGTQIIDALNEIRNAGVEKMIDPELGWRLEVANFAGTYPHSHTKFLVVDGFSATAAGFNYGYLHFPKDHPSGKGYDLLDLALQVNGPVAQEAISVYDDMWEGANKVHCENFFPPEGENWQDTCMELKATSEHLPDVLKTQLPPEGDSNSFSLYRSSVYKEADNVIANSLAAAEDTVKIMQANFSLELICMINIVFPDVCTWENALPFMESIVEAVERDQVHVRVIMENTNSNGLENRVGGAVLMEELERRGLEEFVELRFNKDKIHSKAIQIDDEILFIGSHNLHYSAWGESGLNEYSITTNDPGAIDEFNALFETKWEVAIPFEESQFSTSP